MTSFPDHYLSPRHLPFNRSILGDKFRMGAPGQEPGGSGFLLCLRGTEIFVRQGDAGTNLPESMVNPGDLFIGTWEGRPCRIRSLAEGEVPPPGLVAESLLASRPGLSVPLLSLGGLAGQILHWEASSRHCSRCGGKLSFHSDEWGKKCVACSYSHYPHIHPCAIVLVERPGEVLLVRKPAWPEGRYSLVAGFLEFGECLEETVTREVAEETGVTVEGIEYVGSQCWPFPSQLMAGFRARYKDGKVRPDLDELEDARWFSLSALPVLPPRRSISRFLIDQAGA